MIYFIEGFLKPLEIIYQNLSLKIILYYIGVLLAGVLVTAIGIFLFIFCIILCFTIWVNTLKRRLHDKIN